jgi:leader peptidase (prepilin peptidase)/N-methyltransferase
VTWNLAPALVAAAWGAASGAVLPRIIARLPEPEPDPLEPADDEADFARPVDDPKEPYVDLARLPGLAWKLAVVSAVLAGLAGARIGWSPALLFLGYLVPVGVALALVDWRTRYLPTRLIAPSYVVVGVLVLLGSVLTQDWLSLRSSAIGWVGCFAVFFVMWFISPGSMAYGDVRLAGLLGLAVGWLGLAQVVLGMFTSFLLLAVGGIVLSLARVFHRRHMPFGPFLLAGAFLGAVFPLQLLTAYAWTVEGVTSLVGSVVDAL